MQELNLDYDGDLDERFLEDGFDPNNYTITELRNLFSAYHVDCAHCELRRDFVSLFQERIKPCISAIRASRTLQNKKVELVKALHKTFRPNPNVNLELSTLTEGNCPRATVESLTLTGVDLSVCKTVAKMPKLHKLSITVLNPAHALDYILVDFESVPRLEFLELILGETNEHFKLVITDVLLSGPTSSLKQAIFVGCTMNEPMNSVFNNIKERLEHVQLVGCDGDMILLSEFPVLKQIKIFGKLFQTKSLLEGKIEHFE